MKTPVIFLDWEGVMIGEDKQWSVSAMNELNQFCLEVDAAIVLTTSYRYSQPPKTLHQKMRQNGLDRSIHMLGETRDLDAYRAAAKRGDWKSS
jgi:hypothetical protein